MTVNYKRFFKFCLTFDNFKNNVLVHFPVYEVDDQAAYKTSEP